MGTQRFPRAARLLKSAEYKRVFERPERSSDRYFTVLYRFSGSSRARLGLAVSKRRLKRATSRNRVKRLVRESFRRHQDELRGLDIVVLVKSGLDQVDNPALFDSLERHWRRLADSAARTSTASTNGSTWTT